MAFIQHFCFPCLENFFFSPDNHHRVSHAESRWICSSCQQGFIRLFFVLLLGKGAKNSAPKCCTFLTWFGKPLRLVDIFQWGGYDSGPTLAPAAQCVGGRRSGQTKFTKFQIFSSDPWGLLKRFTAGILMPQRNPEEANLNPKLNLSVQAQKKMQCMSEHSTPMSKRCSVLL